MMNKYLSQRGFTMIEMIMVIVITGIIGGIVAVFLRSPMQGYVDSARRAGMTDIADTALRRITRDLRLALPNSVRVTGTCSASTTCYLEFLPTTGGGRYRAGPPGDQLDFTAPDTSFEVLGTMPTLTAGDSIVVYNLGIPRPASCPAPLPTNCGTDAYEGDNRAAYSSVSAGNIINFTSHQFPFDSPSHRFQVINAPVTYVCAPATSGNDGSGTLTRYWGYAPQAVQPNAVNGSGQLLDNLGLALAGQLRALLANKVSECSFTYDANVVAQRSGLITMRLGIKEGGESVNLYEAAHVSNEP